MQVSSRKFFSPLENGKKSAVPKPSGPEREKQISARLLEARRMTMLSRTAFCTAINKVTGGHLDSTNFANYELGKARVPFGVADVVCRLFRVSPCWLAEGYGPMQGDVPHGIKAPFKAAFSVVYDEKSEQARAWVDAFYLGKRGPDPKRTPEEQRLFEQEMKLLREETLSAVGAAYDSGGTAEKVQLVDRIHLTLHQFGEANPGVKKFPLPWTSGAEFHQKAALDKLPVVENKKGVPLTLTDVIKRARALTEQRGMKSKLASDLGVSASRITDWLAGTYEPGGDATLRLLHWVEIHEGKTKSESSALTPLPPKQARSRNREKPKSSPPRKP